MVVRGEVPAKKVLTTAGAMEMARVAALAKAVELEPSSGGLAGAEWDIGIVCEEGHDGSSGGFVGGKAPVVVKLGWLLDFSEIAGSCEQCSGFGYCNTASAIVFVEWIVCGDADRNEIKGRVG